MCSLVQAASQLDNTPTYNIPMQLLDHTLKTRILCTFEQNFKKASSLPQLGSFWSMGDSGTALGFDPKTFSMHFLTWPIYPTVRPRKIPAQDTGGGGGGELEATVLLCHTLTQFSSNKLQNRPMNIIRIFFSQTVFCGDSSKQV